MEQYVYNSSHLPILRKYRTMKILFLITGCLVLLLQSIAWLIAWVKDVDISVADMVMVGITLVGTLYFVASQSFFLYRNTKIIKVVKSGETFSSIRPKLHFSNKSSLGGALVILCRIFIVLFVVLLGIMIVTFIQNYVNWGEIILKMPIMVFLAVGFLNTSADMRYQAMLEQAK